MHKKTAAAMIELLQKIDNKDIIIIDLMIEIIRLRKLLDQHHIDRNKQ
jgi:hypothetical protein